MRRHVDGIEYTFDRDRHVLPLTLDSISPERKVGDRYGWSLPITGQIDDWSFLATTASRSHRRYHAREALS
jgi:hypothetical protein